VRKQIRDKRERHRLQCERALALFDAWWLQHAGQKVESWEKIGP
jgi:methylenetetrahydrofolate--tRNA-(uracil-5-)-methyltransferase